MKGNCCRDSFFATSTPARMAIVQPFEITGFDRRVRSHRLSKCRLCSAKVLMPCLCILAIISFLAVHIKNYTAVLHADNPKRLEIGRAEKAPIGVLRQEKLQNRLEWLMRGVENSARSIRDMKLQQQNIEGSHFKDAIEKVQMSGIFDGSRDAILDAEDGAVAAGYEGSQFDTHRILALDHESTQIIPLSKMISWYGEAEGGGTCPEDFGNTLINKWRAAKESYCGAGDSTLHRDSSIDCYLIHQTRHHGDGDNLCVMKNVAVNIGLFGEDSLTRSVVQEYVNTRHASQPYIKFPMGFVKANCELNDQRWQPKYMPGWNADWTTGAVASVETTSDAFCDEWVDHPVLVVQRDTFANFFHDSEDFFNVFIAMAVLEWKAEDIQIYLTDLYPKGPFWDIWSDVFSPKGKAGDKASPLTTMTAWDLRNSFGQKISKHNSNKEYHVCYKQLAIGIYGPAAPVTVASWDTPCYRTALVRAYSDYVIRGLGLTNDTHYASASPNRIITITYMARRPSAEWPEKKYCSDTESFFLCRLWATFGARALGRMVSNEIEVMDALKALESRSYDSGATVRFRDVDYNVLTFKEQIKIDLETDIMIGPHGAGLMHNIFMRDRAALIELFIDGSNTNRHFHNLAHWYGRIYKGVLISNPIDVTQMTSEVIEVINRINLKSY